MYVSRITCLDPSLNVAKTTTWFSPLVSGLVIVQESPGFEIVPVQVKELPVLLVALTVIDCTSS